MEMIKFTQARAVFEKTLYISSGLTGLLFVLYGVQRQNPLLLSCCVVILIQNYLIYTGFSKLPLEEVFHETLGSFATIQAMYLNYSLISVHAHLALLMAYSCGKGLFWPGFTDRNRLRWEILFIVIALVYPAIPSIILYLSEKMELHILAFYTMILKPMWLTRCQQWVFAIPGMLLSVYLLYRTVLLRFRTMSIKGSTTAITVFQLCRIFTATFFYQLIGFSTLIPVDIEKVLSLPVQSTPELKGIDMRFRRPQPFVYTPVLLGTVVFAMFGFGSPARQTYWESWRLVCWFFRVLICKEDVTLLLYPSFRSNSVAYQSDFMSSNGDDLVDWQTAIRTMSPESYSSHPRAKRTSEPSRHSSQPASSPPASLLRQTFSSPTDDSSCTSDSSDYDSR